MCAYVHLCLSLLLCFRQGLLIAAIYTRPANVRLQGFSCLYIQSYHKNPEVMYVCYRIELYWVLGNPTQVFSFVWQKPAKPFPWLQICFFIQKFPATFLEYSTWVRFLCLPLSWGFPEGYIVQFWLLGQLLDIVTTSLYFSSDYYL